MYTSFRCLKDFDLQPTDTDIGGDGGSGRLTSEGSRKKNSIGERRKFPIGDNEGLSAVAGGFLVLLLESSVLKEV